MTAISQTQIIHESETQRQHARFPLPAKAFLNGKEYPVKDLSAGGIALYKMDASLARGKKIQLSLRLPFSSFSMDIPLEAEVQHYNAPEKTAGCRFIALQPEQVSFLTHIIKAFIAGDIITSGNLLNIATRNNFTKVRTHANANAAAPSFRRQLPGLFLVALIGLLIATFLGGNLYNSMFIVKTADATVAAPSVSVRAPGEGIFRSRLDAGLSLVQQGQVIGTVTPSNGSAATTLQSPCNCYIARNALSNGEPVEAGQEILSLVPIDARPWIIAEIDPSQGKEIGPESRAIVSVFGSRMQYTGRVTSMESALSNESRGAGSRALMKIKLDQKLPVDFVNRLAAVTFATY